MSLDIVRADEDVLDSWNDYVTRSPQATVFHTLDALRVQAEHADADLHLLAGFKGQEPVGIFPVFEISRGPITGAFSPPPNLWVCYLGPALLNVGKLKRRKAEGRAEQFIEGCLSWLDAQVSPSYTQFMLPQSYTDVRPFLWRGYRVVPEYTYLVDLTDDPDELLDRFSRDARNNIRSAADAEYIVDVGGPEEIEWILGQVAQRYDEQGRAYPGLAGFVSDLYEALPPGSVRPYVLRQGGEPLGGILTIEDADTVYRWQGGMRPDGDTDLAVNDVLDWQVMCDAVERGVATYDLVGAGVPRINRYKSKFNPRLAHTYQVRNGSWGIDRLVGIYRQISNLPSPSGDS